MSRIYNEDDNVCHVGYISVVPSVSSIASSMSNVSLTSSQFRCIPDYIVFGCEFRYISRRQATPVRWDIVKNCALSNGYPQLFSKGEKGIKQVTGAVRRLSNENNGNRFTFDKTTGLYVHIGLSKQPFYIEDIKKICHNFLKYESCLNLIMSPNRIDNDDCLSNRSLFSKDNLETRDLIYECETVKDLQLRMCKNASNFKLNLMNLSTKGSIEFRQHASTFDADKIELWLRFLVWFVSNSILQDRSLALYNSRDDAYAFETLFKYVVDDQKLKNSYANMINSKRT